jgi:hypothetical protein
MGICQAHSSSRQPVKVWRRDLRLSVETAQITVTKVVGKNEHDVWSVALCLHRDHQQEQDG